MLLKIKAKNFKVYDEVEIDFKTISKQRGLYLKSNDFWSLELGKKSIKILKKIGIIGGNASGKSTILDLFSFLSTLISIANYKSYLKEYATSNLLKQKRMVQSLNLNNVKFNKTYT